jgi:tetratricopeptide (TPR) repeat protein
MALEDRYRRKMQVCDACHIKAAIKSCIVDPTSILAESQDAILYLFAGIPFMMSQNAAVVGKYDILRSKFMSPSIRIAQIKHEAEIYFSQGLHQEALTVYERLLANSSDLHPSIVATINESIHHIRSAAQDRDRDEAELMSDVEITLIKKGWKGHATDEECLASAQALVNMGLYKDALEEYRQLLKNRFLTPDVMRGVAMCLVNLVRSRHFTVVVDHFAAEIFKRPKNRKAISVVIAKAIDSKQYPRHFSALCYHLSKVNRDSNDSF